MLAEVGVIISGGAKFLALKKSGSIRQYFANGNLVSRAFLFGDSCLNYRTTPLSVDNVPVLVDYLKKNGYKKLAVFYPIIEFGITYKESFEKLAPLGGIEIVVIEGCLATDKDFPRIPQ